MKNYRTYESDIFQTDLAEVDAAKDSIRNNPEEYRSNLLQVQRYFGEDVVYFTLKQIPEKRSKFDHTVLLVFQRADGSFWAKRHNNSQSLSISYKKK